MLLDTNIGDQFTKILLGSTHSKHKSRAVHEGDAKDVW